MVLLVTFLWCAGLAFAEGIWTQYLTHIDSLDIVSAIAIEGDSLWVGTNGGVVLWDIKKKSYKVLNTADGLADNSVTTITIDHRGIKWFGTIGGQSLIVSSGKNHFLAKRNGISAFDGVRWMNYDRDALGLSGDQHGNYYGNGRINSIAVDAFDNVLIGVMETYGTGDGGSIDEFHIDMKDQSGKWNVIYSLSGYFIGTRIVLLNDNQDSNII